MRLPAQDEHQTVVPIRDAFLGRGETVPVDDAVGRISCESIAGYPPGVPSLLPGERVTAEVVEYLRTLTVGARLHGAADPTFQTLRRASAQSRTGATGPPRGGSRCRPPEPAGHDHLTTIVPCMNGWIRQM